MSDRDDDAITGAPDDAVTLPRDGEDDAAITEPTSHERPRSASGPIEPGDRYRPGRPIARGGMGEIIAAYDHQIGRDVAIKRMLSPRPTSIALARFLREARIQGRLDHPAIVPVHELSYDADGRPFFAMKKLAGTTLSKILREPVPRARFPRQRLLRAFADVCLAIEFAHTRGVIHRDLKPANILLGDFGEVYVLDWGIARLMTADDPDEDPGERTPDDGRTAVGVALGTPGYMAPEQVRGAPDLDGRADVYALGCILFELLAHAPLHPKGEAGLRSAVSGVDARPSRWTDDDIPPELDELCSRATANDRRERLGSARDLGEAVQRYLDGDRDLELRQQLAHDHLVEATAALDGLDDEGQRRIAMRAAGQALALDPTLIGAAELVGRLMLEPPIATPQVVKDELAAADHANARRQARIGVALHAVLVGIACGFALIGMRDGYVAALAIVSSINMMLALLGTHYRHGAAMSLAVIGNLLTIALLARMFTPFLLAPGIAAVIVMAFAFHPNVSSRRALGAVAALGAVIVIGMWAIEALGLVSATFSWSDGVIHLHSPVAQIAALPVAPALCLYVVVLLAAATALAHHNAHAQRSARRHLHVQAWQLRQLISVPVTRPRTASPI